MYDCEPYICTWPDIYIAIVGLVTQSIIYIWGVLSSPFIYNNTWEIQIFSRVTNIKHYA